MGTAELRVQSGRWEWAEKRRQDLWSMWLEESGGCGTVCAEMWWAGKREGSALEKNGRGDSWV